MRAHGLSVEVDDTPEAATGSIELHHRVELGEAVREPGAIGHLVGDRAQQLLGSGQLSGADLGLVHLCLRRHKRELKPDAKDLGQILLLENRLQSLDP
jgi:hypothetical protein